MLSAESLLLFVGRNRWLKRPLLKLGVVPSRGHISFTEQNGIKRLYLNPTDLHGPSYHVMYGGHEGNISTTNEKKKESILEALPRDSGVFFDVGANIGLFSFFTSERRPEAKIFAFEPHPHTFSLLETSISFNQIKNVTPVSQALGAEKADLTLLTNRQNAGGHTFVKEILLSHDESISGQSSVPVTTLDAFVAEAKIDRVNVIKIDVQGFEKEVLLGARGVLKKFKPVVLLECDNPQIVQDDYLKDILGTDYTFKTLNDSKVHAIGEITEFASKELAAGKIQTNLVFRA